MLRKYLLSFVLAFLFALGQQGAVLHEISHVADYSASELSAQSQSNAFDQSNRHDQAPHSPVCDKCLGYAQLAGAVGTSPFVLPILPAAFELLAFTSSSHHSLTLPSYSARAPPQSA